MLSVPLGTFLSFLLCCGSARAWLVTSYFEQQISTGRSGYTYTDVVNVKPTATDFSTVSVETTVDYYYSDVTVVAVLIPTGAGTTVSYDYSAYLSSDTTYYVELEYTASSSCSSQWTYTTTANLNVPSGVTPTPTSVQTSYTQRSAFGSTTTKYKGFLAPTDVPDFSSVSSYYAPYFTRSCSIPYGYRTTATGTDAEATSTDDDYYSYPTSGSRNGYSDGYSDGNDCYVPYGSYDYYYSVSVTHYCDDGSSYKTIGVGGMIMAIILGWLGLFLIIGLLESYIRFSALACGKKARRGLPIAFACLFPFLSCFFLCCTTRGFAARRPGEASTLATQWKETPFWTKIGRWLKWGFRYKYPGFLGQEPERRRRWQDKDKSGNVYQTPRGGAHQTQMAGGLPGPQMAGVPGQQAEVVGQQVDVEGQRGVVELPPSMPARPEQAVVYGPEAGPALGMAEPAGAPPAVPVVQQPVVGHPVVAQPAPTVAASSAA